MWNLLNQGIYAKKEPSPELLSLQKQFSRVHRQGLEPWTPWLREKVSKGYFDGLHFENRIIFVLQNNFRKHGSGCAACVFVGQLFLYFFPGWFYKVLIPQIFVCRIFCVQWSHIPVIFDNRLSCPSFLSPFPGVGGRWLGLIRQDLKYQVPEHDY